MLDVRSRRAWRTWLEKHHTSSSEIWLVFHKRHTGVTCVPYDESVEGALCFGWIDSLVRHLDDARYVRKFTPRKANSRWSTSNRRRYADLAEKGLLTAQGLERAPTTRSGDAPLTSASVLPSYIEETLKKDPVGWQFFQQLAPSYRRAYIGWIDSAKRQETKEKRFHEALGSLAAGKKLGLK
jgi:uncharacterized protein YdeI (YjbR/CyaY-like superfamily)